MGELRPEEPCPYYEEGVCNLAPLEPVDPDCCGEWRYCPFVRFVKRFGPSKVWELAREAGKAGIPLKVLRGAVHGLLYGLAVREKGVGGDRAYPGWQRKKLLELAEADDPELEEKLLRIFEKVLGKEVLDK